MRDTTPIDRCDGGVDGRHRGSVPLGERISTEYASTAFRDFLVLNAARFI